MLDSTARAVKWQKYNGMKKKRLKKSERRRRDDPPTPAQQRARYKPGQSGNPAGRKPGVPNLNQQLIKALIDFKKGNKTYMELILEKALRNGKVMVKLVDKFLMNASPEQQATFINNFEAALKGLTPEAPEPPPEIAPVPASERLDRFLAEEQDED